MNSNTSISHFSEKARLWSHLCWGLLIAQLLLVTLTFKDYGMSWDQPSTHLYGQIVLRYFTSGGSDIEATTYWLRPYGTLFELLAAATERITSLPWWEARNLTSGLLGLTGILGAIRIGTLCSSPRAGFLAGLFLLLTPLYYGHQFINPKDLPFAALNLLTISYVIEWTLAFPSPRWRIAVSLGITLGCTLGVRVGALQIYGLLGLGGIAALAWMICSERRSPTRVQWIRGIGQIALILVLSWGIMIVIWPFGHTEPLRAPFIALKEFSHFWWDGQVLYGGKLVQTKNLPWTYVPNLAIRVLPEFILVGLALFACVVISQRKDRKFVLSASLTLAATAAPMIMIWILGSNLYDGLRHVLFLVIPVVVIAAIGLDRWVASAKDGIKFPIVAAFGISMIITLSDLRSTHPYQYIYFNRLIGGGLENANRDYDLEYWGTSLREAAYWINENYKPNPIRPELLYGARGEPAQFDSYIATNLQGIPVRRITKGEKPRLNIILRRNRQTMEPTFGRVLHTITRHGVPLVDIVEIE